MKAKKQYNTKQGDAILAYISACDGNHVTAEQISEHFKNIDSAIGMATIYRQLDKLEQSGQVKKYLTDNISGACYQFAGGTISNNSSFHIKCAGCGELYHLECGEFNGLIEHIEQKHEFRINPLRTMFYGECKACLDSD